MYCLICTIHKSRGIIIHSSNPHPSSLSVPLKVAGKSGFQCLILISAMSVFHPSFPFSQSWPFFCSHKWHASKWNKETEGSYKWGEENLTSFGLCVVTETVTVLSPPAVVAWVVTPWRSQTKVFHIPLFLLFWDILAADPETCSGLQQDSSKGSNLSQLWFPLSVAAVDLARVKTPVPDSQEHSASWLPSQLLRQDLNSSHEASQPKPRIYGTAKPYLLAPFPSFSNCVLLL